MRSPSPRVSRPASRPATKLGIVGLIWVLYLGTAPVYWLPFVSPELMSLVKHLTIYTAVGVTAVVAFTSGRLTLPWGLAGLAGFLLVAIASMPAVAGSEFQIALYRMTDLAYAAIAFTSFFILAKSGYDITKLMKLATVIIALFCLISLLGALSPAYAWRQPAMIGPFDVTQAGFGGLRTGWSNGTALYVPFAFLWCLNRRGRLSLVGCLVAVAIVLSIVASQYMVGGRAGLLASMVSLVVLAHYLIPAGKRTVGYVVVALVVVTLSGPAVYQHLRLDRLMQDSGEVGIDTLDHFSANRITTYLFALEMMVERPLTGHGFGKANIGEHEIHNVWLKHGAEGGILLLMAELLLVFKILFPTPRRSHSTGMRYAPPPVNQPYVYLWATLLSGFVISMLEPGMLFGSFQVGAVWWCAAGALTALHRYR